KTTRSLSREVELRWCDEPIVLEHSVAEGALHGRIACHAPCAATTMGQLLQLGGDSQLGHRSLAPAGRMPALPEAFADVAAYPAALVRDAPSVLCLAVVTPPASQVLVPLVAQLPAAQ